MNVPVDEEQAKAALIRDIVKKAAGNFLWTALVIKQLRDVETVEELREVLDEVPQEMTELYDRNLRMMEGSRNAILEKHIITWAICAVTPLTADQMKDAIKLSLGMTLVRDLRTSLKYICGHFLNVKNHGQIHVVHETARAFLTNEALDSSFRVDSRQGHETIALACLKYLLSDDLKYTKQRRSAAPDTTCKTPMAVYACLHFSEHISRCSSSSDDLFGKLVKFFNTNVLSWIECVAKLGDLDCLIRTSRHLSNYLRRRSMHLPRIPGDLDSWVVDLPRIVTQFGVNLTSSPAAIHTLVPPFCPRNSAIFRNSALPKMKSSWWEHGILAGTTGSAPSIIIAHVQRQWRVSTCASLSGFPRASPRCTSHPPAKSL